MYRMYLGTWVHTISRNILSISNNDDYIQDDNRSDSVNWYQQHGIEQRYCAAAVSKVAGAEYNLGYTEYLLSMLVISPGVLYCIGHGQPPAGDNAMNSQREIYVSSPIRQVYLLSTYQCKHIHQTIYICLPLYSCKKSRPWSVAPRKRSTGVVWPESVQ